MAPQRWARVRPGTEWKRPCLPVDWSRVLEEHPEGATALAGYVWVQVGGRALHALAAHLEIRED